MSSSTSVRPAALAKKAESWPMLAVSRVLEWPSRRPAVAASAPLQEWEWRRQALQSEQARQTKARWSPDYSTQEMTAARPSAGEAAVLIRAQATTCT
jgi:hypothetical protein